MIKANGAEAVIPPRTNRKEQREYHKHLYEERHLVECFINDKTQQGLTYLTGNVRIASSYSPATSDKG